jgi:hypothetical protein
MWTNAAGNRRGHNLVGNQQPRTTAKGSEHYAWKGDDALPSTKRNRAQKMYSLDACEDCGTAKATDRHHKDDDTGNNDPSNIARLCRRCHMKADGRLERFRERAKAQRGIEKTSPQPCNVCQKLYKPLRKGRCHRCNEYFRRHGVEWTPEAVAPLPPRACVNCPEPTTHPVHGRCHNCDAYWRRTGKERES